MTDNVTMNAVWMNRLHNMDCMDAMKQFPDKYFELAIVDPPYGIDKAFTATSRVAKYGQLGTANDMKPTPEYFAELFRVSKNQIVWGYNHLSDMLPSTKEFIFWYKHQPVVSYSDGELAWTSFAKTARCYDFPFFGAHNSDNERIHPTQKPIPLYRWLLTQYAKPGDKILDTHVGSGSSIIACMEYKFQWCGFEIDKTYFDKAQERIDSYAAQVTMEMY